MSKKVLIISTSLRNNSNSEMLAKEFAKGAREAENDVKNGNVAPLSDTFQDLRTLLKEDLL